MAVPAEQAAVAAFLAGLAGRDPIETHISAVFCGAETAWKLKKAVRLDFLDFSTLDARRHFLQRELELNAPFVPGLYRDVVPVTRSGDTFELGGAGAVVDWVLRMAAVPETDFLDRMAERGRLDDIVLTQLGDEVAAMHKAQPPTPVDDPVGRMRRVVAGNAAAGRTAGLDPAWIAAWERAMAAALDKAAPVLLARKGLVRRAHGDLHLGNLVLWQGRPKPCDALEFDEDLATIDPGYDLAFLLMDLDVRVSRAAANRVLCRYVARTGDAGLVGALAPFLSLRALIRAHVEAKKGGEPEMLLQAAQRYLQPGRPLVLAIGGLMGTGKSTLARALAPAQGPAPGALVLRSDEIRKRLFGVPRNRPLPAAGYSLDATRRTQDAMMEAMRAAAAGGHAVILDATFLDDGLRQAVLAAAGPAFVALWLEAPLAELERRVMARQNDASDATLAVLRAAAGAPAPRGWWRLDATDGAALQQQVQQRLAML